MVPACGWTLRCLGAPVVRHLKKIAGTRPAGAPSGTPTTTSVLAGLQPVPNTSHAPDAPTIGSLSYTRMCYCARARQRGAARRGSRRRWFRVSHAGPALVSTDHAKNAASDAQDGPDTRNNGGQMQTSKPLYPPPWRCGRAGLPRGGRHPSPPRLHGVRFAGSPTPVAPAPPHDRTSARQRAHDPGMLREMLAHVTAL